MLAAAYEFICYKHEYARIKAAAADVNEFWKEKMGSDKDVIRAKYEFVKKITKEYLDRKIQKKEGKNTDKGSIIIAGCSFADGQELDEQNRFHSVLSDASGRTVYNFGFPSASINWIYKRLLLDNKSSSEYNNPEYFIYVYIPDHIRRLFSFETQTSTANIRYKIKNGRLEETKSIIDVLYPLFSIKKLARYITAKETNEEVKNNLPLFNKLMFETKKLADEKYNHPKFILLDYPQLDNDDGLSEQEIKTLGGAGIIYINVEELIGHELINREEYFVSDKIHPNERAWQEIAPALAKRLEL